MIAFFMFRWKRRYVPLQVRLVTLYTSLKFAEAEQAAALPPYERKNQGPGSTKRVRACVLFFLRD